MSDFIVNLTYKLKSTLENLYSFFGSEFLQSTEIMDNSKIELLVKKLELEIQKDLELHQKWLNCWLHLPLSLCRLGENNAQQFAHSYWYVVLKKPWSKVPSLKELCYAKYLEIDVKEENFNDFDLKDALTDEMFFQEFKFQFTDKQLKDLRKKNRITHNPQDSASIIQSDRQREQEADNLFEELFISR
ncbi:2195_t:CDS:2 [Ambispora gerdemannii]|uniref:2195_t:CDS:1 n=1 Tax=Ambispora gerdemannii TaxID=144530 RepID=A0A9N9E791_9GLOM|nr:2195_t:CDS:2 [Ambispora gerdemannii]